MAYAGKNGYDTSPNVLFPEAINIIEWLTKEDKSETFNLSFKGISLYQVGAILQEIGYKNYDISHNGWQMGYWWKYMLVDKDKVSDKLPDVVQISGSGADGSMILSVCEKGE